MKILVIVSCILFFSKADACNEGEYTTSSGSCGKCYYYCVNCDNQRFYNCPRECGWYNNYTGDCDLVNCGGCLPGYDFNINGNCRCTQTSHCCGDTCAKCGGPGQCQECESGLFGPMCQGVCRSDCLRCTGYDSCTECKRGLYGSTCTESCRSECTKCNAYNNCTECIPGRYGQNCSETCRSQCASCTDMNNCTSCVPGKYGVICENDCRHECATCTNNDTCTECIDGRYGHNCESLCGDNCVSCNSYYYCPECKPGSYGNRCNYQCSKRCRENLCEKLSGYCSKGCIDKFYLRSSGSSCSSCYYACTKCSSSRNCSECISGKYGPFCQYDCPGCIDGVCDKNTGECSFGCKHHFYLDSGKCYECPENCLNCTNTVSCTRCITGKYGATCQNSCLNCKDDMCDIASGICTNGCTNNYFTDTNNECVRCHYSCSTCESLEKCGLCTSTIFWGPKCLYYCANCLDGCSKDDGCIAGCDAGYFQYFNESKGGYECNSCPDLCEVCSDDDDCLTCKEGYWGMYCEYKCSGCINNECSRSEGCTKGCVDGYFLISVDNESHCVLCPDNCELCLSNDSCFECKPGYFGKACEYKCSQNHSACIKCTGEDFDSFECIECQENYYPGKNFCQPCNENCKTSSWPYCDSITGTCSHGCQENSFWGRFCENSCKGCKTNVCERSLGCYSGCSIGYYLEIFQSGFYCEPCPQNCISCSNSSYCSDCLPEFYGRQCNKRCSGIDGLCVTCNGQNPDSFQCSKCKAGHYPVGNRCQACSSTCTEGSMPVCNPSNGFCYYGCKGDWLGNKCDELNCTVNNCALCDPGNPYLCSLCDQGFYAGGNGRCNICPNKCGLGSVCDQATGFCANGCMAGWSGDSCDQTCHSRCLNCDQDNKDICYNCQIWFYGKNCDNTCNVDCNDEAEKQICNKDTGDCLNGCKDGHWGLVCSELCSNGCKDSLCNNVTGACVKGCKAGTWGAMCTKCSEGCKDNVCEVTTGECYKGCKPGFREKLCIPDSESSGQKSDSSGVVTGLAVGLVLLAIVSASAIGMVIWILKKRRSQHTSQANGIRVEFRQASAVYSESNEALPRDRIGGISNPVVT